MNVTSLVVAASVAVFAGAACSAPARTQATTNSSGSLAASATAVSTASTTVPLSTPVVGVVPTTIEPAASVGATVLIPSATAGPPAQVTVVNIIDPAVGADQFAVPIAGGRFVGVRLQVALGGSSPAQEDLTNDTSIFDSQGSTYAPVQANLQNCPAFKTGVTLAPGQVTTGCVTFDVGNLAKITDVTFTPGGQFGTVSAEWEVNA